MNKKDKRIIISSIVSMILLVVVLGGYWILNKEQVNLVVKGKELEVSTFKKTVEELLIEQNIAYDEDDKIIPDLETKVVDYMNIEVIDVKQEAVEEEEEIPFEVKTVDDKTLLKGKSKVEQEGVPGKKKLTYVLTYENDKLVEKVLEKEVVSTNPTEKIIKNGIKEEIIVASRGETSRNQNANYSQNTVASSSNGGTHMVVEASAYYGHGITSTGTKPKWGTIAVDPRVIPYGTRVYIPQFNMTFVAEDCGGAIKGNKIDIFMNSRSECYNWGRRKIDIYVIG